MVSLFDKIKIVLGMKANVADETEPVVDQPVEFQLEPVVDIPLVDNKIYYSILRNAPEAEPEKQVEEVNQQVPELNHASELEQLKHYAELAKQNKMDSRGFERGS